MSLPISSAAITRFQEKLKRDVSTNKPVYMPTVHWKDRTTTDKFSAAVIKLLLAKYPGALGGPQ